MPELSSLGITWEEFVSDWCLGVQPAVSAKKADSALHALKRLWPSRFQELVGGSARGIAVIAPTLHLGLTLAACEQLEGFDEVLARISAGERSALSEAGFAAALVGLGFKVVLEPKLEGKRLDAAIQYNKEVVYAEVACPDQSDAKVGADAAIQRLAKSLVDQNPGMAIEVLVHTDDQETARQVLESVRLCPPDSEIREISGIGTLVKSASSGVDVPSKLPLASVRPVMAEAEVRIAGDVITVARVNLPITDKRAHRILTRKLRQFSKAATNILVLNVSAVPEAFDGWVRVVESWFQPTRNRRVGAVLMYDEKVFSSGVHQRWRVLRNPHSYRELPEGLLESIEGLDESQHWKA